MAEAQLRSLAEHLHAELEGTETLTDESREVLKAVLADLTRLLEKPSAPPAGLADRIKDAGVTFERAHPKVATALEELGNVLSNMGI